MGLKSVAIGFLTKGVAVMHVAYARRELSDRLAELPERNLREVLHFVEFLRIREDREFIDYVNLRTQQTLSARERGEKFYTLRELQKEYGVGV